MISIVIRFPNNFPGVFQVFSKYFLQTEKMTLCRRLKLTFEKLIHLAIESSRGLSEMFARVTSAWGYGSWGLLTVVARHDSATEKYVIKHYPLIIIIINKGASCLIRSENFLILISSRILASYKRWVCCCFHWVKNSLGRKLF